ncbi:Ca2+-transporting ATPase [Mariniphaga anaerophila]|uniref:Ca2+-transporting ATPase n=1 Tax=Mariniphaga anaerophila TaxID=1484053 RepID=A0A1M5FXH8_9BACT|nr:HAD-IC family P-type ATPase [Mariniphaga anaerophila]SHF96260.1 Ca2+-transporting ATPase [Mariniphaga anaerophila]
MGNKNSALWHAEPYNEVIKSIESSEEGLTTNEAKKRLQKFGPNQIKKKSNDGPLIVLWRQINNPLIWVLIGSSTLAVLLGKITDGAVVMAVVVINTIIGFIQEFKAGKAIDALSEMVPENATVHRDGQKASIPVAEIVPGDIVELEAGERIPADMRLIQQKNLSVEEAALTGESVPSQKSINAVDADVILGDRKCMVYSGTLVATGTGKAVVVSTGMNTELGKISNMLNETTDLETPLTQKLGEIGKYLTIGIVAITAVIMVVGIIRATGQGIALNMVLKDSLVFAIALAVGAIPEGLPAVVTIALAIGVQRMARRKAIIRKLPAVETLGSTTVICSDKTGTLTRNEMTVNQLWTKNQSIQVTGAGYNTDGIFQQNGNEIKDLPKEIKVLLEDAALCSDASFKAETNGVGVTGDPTEIALVVAAAKAHLDVDLLRNNHPRKDVIPFDSESKFMATLNENTTQRILIKGAPEVILKRCATHLSGETLEQDTVLAEMERLGSKGMRVLAVAQKTRNHSENRELSPNETEGGFQFVGLLGMIDPPRTEAIEAIKACHNAGIVVKMITGDHQTTARSIGMDLGLSEGKTITGMELVKMSNETLAEVVKHTNIFARVAPEHKLRLVKALQANNQIVAMTGDGVNDAPSLKQSNIGVAMGITGTSVSKESSDIVLADDNFASISAAVEEGRRVYDNLLKSLAFLLPTNLGLAFILIYGIMFFPFNLATGELLLPMLPTQLLWINLVAAVALALPLAFEVKEPNVMKRPPRKPDAPLFNKFVTFRVVFVSLFMTAGTIIVFNLHYAHSLTDGLDPAFAQAKAQTMAVTFVILFQIFYMLNCRSLRDSLLKIGFFSNPLVFLGIGIVLALQVVFIYAPFMHSIFKTVPLSAKEVLIATLFGFAIFPVIWFEKWIHFLINRKKKIS